MSSNLESFWHSINTDIAGEKLAARIVFPEINNLLMCALDSKGQRHFLIPLSQTDKGYEDVLSRGVQVTTRELTIFDRDSELYIDLKCLEPRGYDIFNSIGEEICSALILRQLEPVSVIKEVLAKWRNFWGQLPAHILTREKQIGLFSELWFLNFWLYPLTGSKAVHSWRGPWGSRHDFEFPNKSIEVKGSTNVQSRTFHVNGIEQLESPENGDLFFFGLMLREEQGSSNSLPTLIDDIRTKLEKTDSESEIFEDGLVRAGYSDFDKEEYARMKLRIHEENLYIINDQFPRIIRSSFKEDLSGGIEKINYKINLNTFDHLIIANQPDKIPKDW
ncbi:MAG: PD-(D/E)XK motif protein [Leptospirales bacterium]